MYNKSFYITTSAGNNAFSFDKRVNKKLFIPSLKKISNFNEIKLQIDKKKIAFEDFNFDGNLESCLGLEYFYEIIWRKKRIYLFDNHNHAFYFWYLSKYNKIIKNNSTLFHIDEHSDMRNPKIYLKDNEVGDLKKVFEFTNFKLNVGNYIIPAQRQGLIGEVIQIRSNEGIKKAQELLNSTKSDTILNLDLDFFRPELDFIDYNFKKEIVLNIAKKVKLITVATSPFFINQKLAIKVFKDIFK